MLETSHEFSGVRYMPVEVRLREIKSRVFFLEPLQHDLLLYLILRKGVQSIVAFEDARPNLCFKHFLQVEVQLLVFDHPERL